MGHLDGMASGLNPETTGERVSQGPGSWEQRLQRKSCPTPAARVGIYLVAKFQHASTCNVQIGFFQRLISNSIMGAFYGNNKRHVLEKWAISLPYFKPLCQSMEALKGFKDWTDFLFFNVGKIMSFPVISLLEMAEQP